MLRFIRAAWPACAPGHQPKHVSDRCVASRYVAAAIVCILCLLPAEAHLSSYGITQTRNFNGYQLSVTFPSVSRPAEAERARVEREQGWLLERATALSAQAFDHYVRGTHPYVGVRANLLPTQAATADGGYWRTSPVALLDGVEITLFVQPNIPDRVRNQVPRDFLLSQLAKGGVLSTPTERAPLPRSTDTRGPEQVLEHGLYSIAQLIYAQENRARIDAAIAREGMTSRMGIVLQGIRLTLDGAPIADALFVAALALPPSPRAKTVEALLDLSPRTDLAQVRKWVAQVEENRRGNYVELSSTPAPPPSPTPVR